MLGEHYWHKSINSKIKRQREMESEKNFLQKKQDFSNSFQAELAYAVRWMM